MPKNTLVWQYGKTIKIGEKTAIGRQRPIRRRDETTPFVSSRDL